MVYHKKKVLVGMSGGVDSSVTALLLKREGVAELRSSSRFANARAFDVAGAYMKCWDYNEPDCSGPEDESMARLAASHIGIPFYVFDFKKEYKNKVFGYFLREQKAGLTPNPDIMCNKNIKFGLFFEKALELGFDYIATGHYARLRRSVIMAAKDKNKDQSYFLAFIKPEVLKRVIFPLGNYTKKEVRKIAEKSKLPNAKRPDSQGLCFVGEVKMESFLKRYIKQKPGLIVDVSGKTIGQHQGLWFYTIGQRKGIGLAGGPYFVLGKDLENNVLVVTKNEKDLFGKELTAKNINWLSENFKKSPARVKVMIRYRQEPTPATLFYGSATKVVFDKPQRAITPGQAAVFYKNQQLLGGGLIA